jgi:hypothetical protein
MASSIRLNRDSDESSNSVLVKGEGRTMAMEMKTVSSALVKKEDEIPEQKEGDEGSIK